MRPPTPTAPAHSCLSETGNARCQCGGHCDCRRSHRCLAACRETPRASAIEGHATPSCTRRSISLWTAASAARCSFTRRARWLMLSSSGAGTSCGLRPSPCGLDKNAGGVLARTRRRRRSRLPIETGRDSSGFDKCMHVRRRYHSTEPKPRPNRHRWLMRTSGSVTEPHGSGRVEGRPKSLRRRRHFAASLTAIGASDIDRRQ
jgi:hypothetical protein